MTIMVKGWREGIAFFLERERTRDFQEKIVFLLDYSKLGELWNTYYACLGGACCRFQVPLGHCSQPTQHDGVLQVVARASGARASRLGLSVTFTAFK